MSGFLGHVGDLREKSFLTQVGGAGCLLPFDVHRLIVSGLAPDIIGLVGQFAKVVEVFLGVVDTSHTKVLFLEILEDLSKEFSLWAGSIIFELV